MKIALLIAPFRRRTPRDVQALTQAKRDLVTLGYVPVFLPDTLRDVLDDEHGGQRELALLLSRQFCRLLHDAGAEAFVVLRDGQGLSEGMKSDLESWGSNYQTLRFK